MQQNRVPLYACPQKGATCTSNRNAVRSADTHAAERGNVKNYFSRVWPLCPLRLFGALKGHLVPILSNHAGIQRRRERARPATRLTGGCRASQRRTRERGQVELQQKSRVAVRRLAGGERIQPNHLIDHEAFAASFKRRLGDSWISLDTHPAEWMPTPPVSLCPSQEKSARLCRTEIETQRTRIRQGAQEMVWRVCGFWFRYDTMTPNSKIHRPRATLDGSGGAVVRRESTEDATPWRRLIQRHLPWSRQLPNHQRAAPRTGETTSHTSWRKSELLSLRR